MAKRRHTADRIASRFTDRIAVCALDGCRVEGRGQADGVQSIRAGHEGHHRSSVREEHQRLHDLAHGAPDGAGGVFRGPRSLRKAPDVQVEPGRCCRSPESLVSSRHRSDGTWSARLPPTGISTGERLGAESAATRPQTLEPDLGNASVGSRTVKAVIVADGAHAQTDRRVLAGADLVIAADGGADWLARIGATPDRLVGDLDSVSPDLVSTLSAAGVTIDRHPVDKDASDLELSLAAAVAAGADELVVLGALGGELDHLVCNLLILGSDLVAGRQVRLVHDRTTARMPVGPAELALDGAAGSRIGLFAVGEAAIGVTTRGLRWPLTDARLEAGSSRGLANVVDDPPAAVALRAGRLLVVQIEPEESSPATKEGET